MLRGGWETAAAQVAAAQQLRRHVHRRHRRQRPRETGHRARRRRCGPTSTTTASSICSSATRTRPSQLFRNKGNGTFEDIARAAGVDRTAFTKGVAAGDYDNDGWPDLYVSNLGGRNFLYRNNRDGTFTEVRERPACRGAGHGFPDLVLRLRQRRLARPVRDELLSRRWTRRRARTCGLPHNAPTMKLYRNLGDGSFPRRHRAGRASTRSFMPMGANFGDIDNDGFLDIYLGTGNPSYAALVAAACCCTTRTEQSFVDVTASSGTGELHKGHGVAFADLDNDGDEDIVFEVGGATPGDAHALPAVRESRARQRLDRPESRRRRRPTARRLAHASRSPCERRRRSRAPIHRTVGSGGSFGASPLQQHIGLGAAARIVDVEIWWPASGDPPAVRERRRRTSCFEITRTGEPLARDHTPRRSGADHVSVDAPSAATSSSPSWSRVHRASPGDTR